MLSEKIILKNGTTYLHSKKAADLLDVSVPAVRAACSSGKLVCAQMGGAWYVDQKSIKTFKSRSISSAAARSIKKKVESKAKYSRVKKIAKEAVLKIVVGREIRSKYS